jgi:hypothetical protein
MKPEQEPVQEQTLKQVLIEYLVIFAGFVLIVLTSAFILFQVGKTIYNANKPFPTSLIHHQK